MKTNMTIFFRPWRRPDTGQKFWTFHNPVVLNVPCSKDAPSTQYLTTHFSQVTDNRWLLWILTQTPGLETAPSYWSDHRKALIYTNLGQGSLSSWASIQASPIKPASSQIMLACHAESRTIAHTVFLHDFNRSLNGIQEPPLLNAINGSTPIIQDIVVPPSLSEKLTLRHACLQSWQKLFNQI